MQIQYVSKYIALSEEGLVPRLECPMDQGSLLCNLDNEENIYLYCLACSYKNIMGIEIYNKIMNEVNNVK
jgi:hypothetical protein